MKIELSELKREVAPELFICMASFEERCLSVANHIDVSNIKNAVVLWNQEYENFINDNLLSLSEIFGDKTRTVDLRNNNPLLSADQISSKVLPYIQDCEGECIIDITTFTHEQLLILVKILSELPSVKNIKLTYTGAGKYSINTKKNDVWLSKGVSEIRAILGYSGIMLPSRKLHLIILIGFESERAERLVLYSEPALITLGRGRKHQSVESQYFETNAEFHEKVKKFTEDLLTSDDTVRQFEFSCVNPIETMKDILDEVENTSEYNIAVCPLNTKPSTIGAALASFVSDRIQLIYPKAIEYNVEGYSTPGTHCTIFELQNLFDAVTEYK